MEPIDKITAPPAPLISAENGSVRFVADDGTVVLLLQADGKIFIRGEQVDDNKAVYKAFREWSDGLKARRAES